MILFYVFNTDGVSECGTSYYDEYDPFDYLYSCGTHYSDPVYEAVNKIDRSLNISTTTDTYAALGIYLNIAHCCAIVLFLFDLRIHTFHTMIYPLQAIGKSNRWTIFHFHQLRLHHHYHHEIRPEAVQMITLRPQHLNL